jgi:aminotransferase in exopolysaccharide biosynthesis
MHKEQLNKVISFIRQKFNEEKNIIPLHEPRFAGNEKKYVQNAIDSTFVSSVGQYVNQFENMLSAYTGSTYSIATVNGTSALHIALLLAGVQPGDEVITQPLTFVATANAIIYTGAEPVFIDVDLDTMGLSPQALNVFLKSNMIYKKGKWLNKSTGKHTSACVPMHTFGFPNRIDDIIEICNEYEIPVVEDAAEALGSFYKNKHTGTFGQLGIFSLNGNKIVTCGGGGAIVTDNEELAIRAKHLTTTAKVKHPWLYEHDEIGYNFRMPNLNAAMACAQLEQIEMFVDKKRLLAQKYNAFFDSLGMKFRTENNSSKSNYWLMSIELENRIDRDEFLEVTNKSNIYTRPVWSLMSKLPMYHHCQSGDLYNAAFLEERIVNIPSSVIL